MRRLHILFIFLLFFSSCSVLRRFKASEARDYGFVKHPEYFSKDFDSRPFHRRWINFKEKLYSLVKSKKKKEVYFHPIDIGILTKQANKISDEKNRFARLDEVNELARYFEFKLKMALKAKNKDYVFIDKPKPKILNVHIALVEVEPTNPYINATGTVAGFFVPGGGLIKSFAKGGVAIEGYFDATSIVMKKPKYIVLEQFKDRESDKAAPFTVKDFQKYAHVRSSIDDWSLQIADIIIHPIGYKVDDSLPFELSVY